MSTTEVLKRGGADAQSTDERARAAVKNFHRMQPSLTAYARALTGKSDVQVVVSPDSNGHTDGKKIFFRPPLSLGDNTPHQRALCDKRDPDTLRQTCPACDVREQVLIVIYHEIAHIAQGSFEEISEYDRAQALDYGLSLVDRRYADAVKHRVAHADSRTKSTYIGMAGLISPYLPGIVNALEDARVNAAAARARRGTKVMFAVDTMRVLSEGFEQKMPDGTIETVYWNTRPLNAQMICALYARAAGYPMEQFFVPEVVAALDDSKVKEILSDFPTIRNAKGVYVIAIALLMRLRELGFYHHPTDPTSEPEDSSDDQPEETSEDDSRDSTRSDRVGESQPAGEDDPERESGDGDGSPEEDQADSGTEDGGSEQGDSDDTSKSDEGDDGGAEESESGSPTGGSDEQAQSNNDGSPSDDKGNSDGESQSRGEDEGDDATSDGSKNQGSHASSDGPEGDDASTGSADESEVDSGDNQGSSSDESENSSDVPDGREFREEGDSSSDENGEDSPSGAGSDHQPNEGEAVHGDDNHGDLGEGESEDVGTGDSGGPASPSDQTGKLNEGGPDLAGTNPEDANSKTADPVAKDSEDGDSDGRRDDSGSASEEVIDTGADEGLGGIEVIENSAFDRLPMGEPEEVNGTIHEIAHPEERPSHVYEEAAASKEMEVAIIQGLYFETPSRNIHGVREHYYDSPIYMDGQNMSAGWDTSGYSHWGYSRRQLGVEGDFDCDEKTLGPALLKMRVAFADNKRATSERNRKSGRINSRVLGKRAALGDPRLFKKRTIPGKKDYFVLIGVDISGSTIGRNIMLAKRAAMAQSELCARMGIKFAVYAHSGNYHLPDFGRSEGMDLEIYHIKDPDEPWTDKTKERLNKIGPDSANLDGHTFEYYRKVLDRRTETHRVILYYTDGKMPAENYEEELEILKREIKICRQRQYVLMGVGIRTDSPTQHGLDTVEVNGDEDIVKVVERLEKRLLEIM